jgi:hypothetical protein
MKDLYTNTNIIILGDLNADFQTVNGRRLKTMDQNGKKLENQKVSFVTLVVTIFYSSYYTNMN